MVVPHSSGLCLVLEEDTSAAIESAGLHEHQSRGWEAVLLIL